MKKRSAFKRLLCMLLAVVLLCGGVPAGAVDNSGADVEIEDDNLQISAEVAGYIAEFFIRDMIPSGTTVWSEETQVTEVVPMYDAQGENITAYAVELTEGFIVVTGYVDCSSLILEWSDTGLPTYKQSESEAIVYSAGTEVDKKIIYTGLLNYYLDDGGETIETIDGVQVARDDVSNELESLRDIENVPEKVADYIMSVKAANYANETPGYNQKPSDYITDPFIYAQYVYAGEWTCLDWSNKWQKTVDAVTPMTYSDKTEKGWNCAVISTTNLIKFCANKYNIMRIRNVSSLSVYNTIRDIGGYYNINSGISGIYLKSYVEKCLNEYDINATVNEYETPGVPLHLNKISRVISTSKADNKIMLVYFTEPANSPYRNHTTLGYAYTRLTNGTASGQHTFVKLCDVKSKDARYVEASAMNDSAFFLEVCF